MNEELERRVEARTRELQMTNQALSQASKAKDEFLATMSHELRTPLTSVLGLTELLETGLQGPLTEKQLKSIQTIHTSGEHLLQLINDVLDLSKIEAGRLVLERTTVAVAEIAEASLQLVSEQAKQKDIQLTVTQSPQGMSITGDRRRLIQVLVNLLDNAVKFTPAGGEVGLDISGDAATESIAFAVWDTGIGISETDMPRLFQPFTQLDSRLARRHGGTGLGLALVRRMAEMHGGGVAVESSPDLGSRFVATLPWSPVILEEQNETIQATMAVAAVDERPLTDVLGRTPVVLLAEDSPASAAIITEYLELTGCSVIRAEHGEAALRQAEATHPDLILMDIQMPQMDGLEATQRLRAHHDCAVATIPVVALTALAMPGDRERCLNAGANAYLRKPFNLRMLRDVIRVQLFEQQEQAKGD
ncbi:MAG: response regulator [Anaerolineales bacterium]|nr:response regulator [Anaerolineales bacterium]